MKRLSLIFFSFLIILLSGCNKKSSDVKIITSELTFLAEYENNNIKNEYFVEIKKDKTIISVVKPEKIEDTKFIFTENSCKVSYKEITADLNIKSNENFIPRLIYSAFTNATNKEAEILTENKETYFSSRVEDLEFKLYIGNSGLPLKLIFPENNTEIIIKNATITTIK
ncbi:MAG: hypothetical protein IJP34_05190 [Clostridia bacterium]|nr:hypothetical protein [Clostridia bacterium]